MPSLQIVTAKATKNWGKVIAAVDVINHFLEVPSLEKLDFLPLAGATKLGHFKKQ